MAKQIRIQDIVAKKNKEGISMLTAYDYPTAQMLDAAGIDMILVGDSLGNVVLGLKDTLAVNMQNMIHHAQAVSRGVEKALIIVDLPFGSYQSSIGEAVKNASRLMKAGAHAVKLEGGKTMEPTIKRLVEVGIPVVAHIGLMPQAVHQIGGYRTLGKNEAEAEKLFEDALSVEKAGAFSVVMECIEKNVSKKITQELRIPTIGIGCGNTCDGQVLVTNDLLGYTMSSVPSFVKPKANLKELIMSAVGEYVSETKGQSS